MRNSATNTIIALAFVGLGVQDAAAETSLYNGAWRVQMVKHAGLCDNESRYAIAIRDGNIRYFPEPGDAPMTFTGRVQANGQIEIHASRGPARVVASGQLRSASGSGTWQLPLLGCSGTWMAQRSDRVRTSAREPQAR